LLLTDVIENKYRYKNNKRVKMAALIIENELNTGFENESNKINGMINIPRTLLTINTTNIYVLTSSLVLNI
jgi:c-di-GMP-related signal transduction protein